MTKYAFIDQADGYYEIELPDGAEFPPWTSSLTPTGPILAPAHSPTKQERIAHTLATQGDGKDRTVIQLAIQLSELTATIQAPSYGMTPAQAIAYAYSKNATYKRSKDTEAAIRAVELEP